MNRLFKLNDITDDLDDIELNDLSSWIKKQQEKHNKYGKLFIEKERDYGYHQGEEKDVFILYGSRPETKLEEEERITREKEKQDRFKADRKKRWEQLNREFKNED